MPCYLCKSIPQNVRGANAGNHLVQIGQAEIIERAGQKPIVITKHKCSECGSIWRHTNDETDENAGWAFSARLR